MPRLPDLEVAELDAADARAARDLARDGRKRVFAANPVIRLEGPLAREAYAAGLTARGLRTGFALADN